jgi:hypothetical protein
MIGSIEMITTSEMIATWKAHGRTATRCMACVKERSATHLTKESSAAHLTIMPMTLLNGATIHMMEGLCRRGKAGKAGT